MRVVLAGLAVGQVRLHDVQPDAEGQEWQTTAAPGGGTVIAVFAGMDLIPLKFAAANLGLSKGYVRALCRAHRVPGALFDGRRWFLPESARVIRKTAGLYAAAADPASSEARKQAELAQRMQRLAAALSSSDVGSPPDGNDDGR